MSGIGAKSHLYSHLTDSVFFFLFLFWNGARRSLWEELVWILTNWFNHNNRSDKIGEVCYEFLKLHTFLFFNLLTEQIHLLRKACCILEASHPFELDHQKHMWKYSILPHSVVFLWFSIFFYCTDIFTRFPVLKSFNALYCINIKKSFSHFKTLRISLCYA